MIKIKFKTSKTTQESQVEYFRSLSRLISKRHPLWCQSSWQRLNKLYFTSIC